MSASQPTSGETRFISGPQTVEPDFLPDLGAPGFDRDPDEAATVTQLLCRVFDAYALHAGRPTPPIEFDRRPIKAAKILRTAATALVPHPLLEPDEAALRRALLALADVYELRAARPAGDDEIAAARFHHLMRVALTCLHIVAAHRRRIGAPLQ